MHIVERNLEGDCLLACWRGLARRAGRGGAGGEHEMERLQAAHLQTSVQLDPDNPGEIVRDEMLKRHLKEVCVKLAESSGASHR